MSATWTVVEERPRTLNDLPPVLLVPEAAEVLRVHPNTVYLMIERKNLRATRVGKGKRALRILKEDLIALMGAVADGENRAA